MLQLLRAGAECQAAAAHKQSDHQDQAARINVDVETLHFATAATKEKYNQQDPCAVASAAAFFAATAAAVTVVEHSVEHSLPPFADFLRLSYLACFKAYFTIWKKQNFGYKTMST